jgi:c-di-GMP-binding flagellar brake protein YcgR
MPEYGDHQVQPIERALRQVSKNRTLLRFRIENTRFDQLAVIEAVHIRDGALFFQLDLPAAAARLLTRSDGWTVHVEFTGQDKTLQFFKVRRGRPIEGGFWFEAPERIERLQRRRDFRLEAPPGAVLEVTRKRRPFRLGVIDISMGGALCLVDAISPKLRKTRIFRAGRTFKRTRLVVPSDAGDPTSIRLEKARVVRTAQNPVTGAFEYGLMFLDMDRETARELKELLYRLQREYLRKRKTLISP